MKLKELPKNISDKIIKMYFDAEFDRCLIFYNKFKSVISQIPTEQQVIPAEKSEDETNEDQSKDNSFFEEGVSLTLRLQGQAVHSSLFARPLRVSSFQSACYHPLRKNKEGK